MVKIANLDETTGARLKIREAFTNIKDESIMTNTKGPGFNSPNVVAYSVDLDFWWILDDKGPNGNVSYNAFGIGRPKEKNDLQICELNYQLNFMNFRYSTVVLIDEEHNFSLVHSGNISVGKKVFWEEYKGNRIKLKAKTGLKDFALIAVINSPDFPVQLLGFVKEVERIKKLH